MVVKPLKLMFYFLVPLKQIVIRITITLKNLKNNVDQLCTTDKNVRANGEVFIKNSISKLNFAQNRFSNCFQTNGFNSVRA